MEPQEEKGQTGNERTHALAPADCTGWKNGNPVAKDDAETRARYGTHARNPNNSNNSSEQGDPKHRTMTLGDRRSGQERSYSGRRSSATDNVGATVGDASDTTRASVD